MAISFVALVTLVSYRNEPKKMTLICCAVLIVEKSRNHINPLVNCPHACPRQEMGRRDSGCSCWVAMPISIAWTANVDRRRRCRLVRPVRMVQRRQGFFPPQPPSRVLLFPPLPWLLLSSSLLLLLLWMPFPLEAEAPAAAVIIPRAIAAYPAPPEQEKRMPLALGPCDHGDGVNLRHLSGPAPIFVATVFVFVFVVLFYNHCPPPCTCRRCGSSCRPPQPPSAAAICT